MCVAHRCFGSLCRSFVFECHSRYLHDAMRRVLVVSVIHRMLGDAWMHVCRQQKPASLKVSQWFHMFRGVVSLLFLLFCKDLTCFEVCTPCFPCFPCCFIRISNVLRCVFLVSLMFYKDSKCFGICFRWFSLYFIRIWCVLMCFEVFGLAFDVFWGVLRCARATVFYCFSYVSIDLRCCDPVWALYNIKEEVGSAFSPCDSWGLRAPKYGFQHCTGCPCAKRWRDVAAFSIVPGAHVPNGGVM